jgi:hypothetical protein
MDALPPEKSSLDRPAMSKLLEINQTLLAVFGAEATYNIC